MGRNKIVAANWKMNLDMEQAAAWLADVTEPIEHFKAEVMVFPSFIMVGDLMDLYEGNKIVFGAQNCSHKEGGAYTGEVSAKQLMSVGIDYVLVGHSERREYFFESNEIVKEKLKQALKNDLIPIFCCGEPLQVRNNNEQLSFVKQQLEESLFTFSEEEISNIIIAYEPVWAIGTGLNATTEQAQEMHAFIRAEVASKYSQKTASEIRILYGGSCKPENAKELFSCKDVDGGLIGGASLKANDFLEIVNAAG